jgi:hypothetical protein
VLSRPQLLRSAASPPGCVGRNAVTSKMHPLMMIRLRFGPFALATSSAVIDVGLPLWTSASRRSLIFSRTSAVSWYFPRRPDDVRPADENNGSDDISHGRRRSDQQPLQSAMGGRRREVGESAGRACERGQSQAIAPGRAAQQSCGSGDARGISHASARLMLWLRYVRPRAPGRKQLSGSQDCFAACPAPLP